MSIHGPRKKKEDRKEFTLTAAQIKNWRQFFRMYGLCFATNEALIPDDLIVKGAEGIIRRINEEI